MTCIQFNPGCTILVTFEMTDYIKLNSDCFSQWEQSHANLDQTNLCGTPKAHYKI